MQRFSNGSRGRNGGRDNGIRGAAVCTVRDSHGHGYGSVKEW